MRDLESWSRQCRDWLHWLIAKKLFPPIESPALSPIRGRRSHAAASIVEDWWEPGYHGDPTEDDKWPDEEASAPNLSPASRGEEFD